MKRRYAVTILLVGLLLGLWGLSPGHAAVMDEAKALPWTTEHLSDLKALLHDKAAVLAFLQELYRSQYPSAEEEPRTFVRLCESELVDLNNNGTVELVATLDNSGRGFCNEILVVHRTDGRFRIASSFFPGIGVDDLKYRIVDLNRDGVKELRVPRWLADAEFGIDPRPIIDDIYTWDGAKLRQVNASFKDYYRRLLPLLQAKLEALREGRTRVVDPREKALLEAAHAREIEEVQRILVTE
jgi:hypothetical protein